MSENERTTLTEAHMGTHADRSLVKLRAVDERDVDDILGWVNDHSVVGNLATFAGKPLTRDDELAWVRKMHTSAEDRVYTVSSADGRYLGQVGVHQIFWRSQVARGAAVIANKGDHGKGYGSAAIASLLDIAFGDRARGGLGLHKMWLMVFRTNERSLKTWQRLGFQQEGILRDEYFHDGKWHDMVRLSMLAPEWQSP
jgi:RimJ/RimL family protein N-acetyltransferase